MELLYLENFNNNNKTTWTVIFYWIVYLRG